jgi:rfaE bifunctional protein nucleotidyltransferase chain/domain
MERVNPIGMGFRPRNNGGRGKKREFNHPHSKVISLVRAVTLRERWRVAGKTVVLTNGCFDLLHVGHVANLQACKGCGDILLVGLNSDESVRENKGPDRPFMPMAHRAEMLAALTVVDHVIFFKEKTAEEIVRQIRPDVYAKGDEYSEGKAPPIPEEKIVRSYGGSVRFIHKANAISTSGIVDRIRGAVKELPRTACR